MIRPKLCLMSLVMSIALLGMSNVVDSYTIDMSLKIPMIYNNGESLGSRKITSTKISGVLNIEYFNDGSYQINMTQLSNTRHRLSDGSTLTYKFYDLPYANNLVYIGDNRKNVFKTPGINLSFALYPSYAITEMNEDNSLFLNISGYGKSSNMTFKNSQTAYSINGYITGQIGCGCSDYGHISPTRLIGPYNSLDIITDIAPVYGTWKMKFKQRTIK